MTAAKAEVPFNKSGENIRDFDMDCHVQAPPKASAPFLGVLETGPTANGGRSQGREIYTCRWYLRSGESYIE